ncbi:DUF1090 family protein [Asaia prunellae]|uniref:DUF1090 family protein n=1 Tax=Asaia prunellae TaxID=610245 RepID=UPI00131F453F|nr:DUF1090 family protein [Asaia prunellae]
MKLTILTLGTLLVGLAASQAQAGTNCDKKIQNLEYQISIARNYNNTQRITGLERSLDQVKLNCQQNQYYYDKRKTNRQRNRHHDHHDRNRDN